MSRAIGEGGPVVLDRNALEDGCKLESNKRQNQSSNDTPASESQHPGVGQEDTQVKQQHRGLGSVYDGKVQRLASVEQLLLISECQFDLSR